MPKPSDTHAIRQHHRERLKDRIRFRWGRKREPAADTGNTIGKALAAPAACSCAMCGNPRKYFNEPTLQERRFDEATKCDEES